MYYLIDPEIFTSRERNIMYSCETYCSTDTRFCVLDLDTLILRVFDHDAFIEFTSSSFSSFTNLYRVTGSLVYYLKAPVENKQGVYYRGDLRVWGIGSGVVLNFRDICYNFSVEGNSLFVNRHLSGVLFEHNVMRICTVNEKFTFVRIAHLYTWNNFVIVRLYLEIDIYGDVGFYCVFDLNVNLLCVGYDNYTSHHLNVIYDQSWANAWLSKFSLINLEV